MSDTDAAWLAGLLEGEGHFTVSGKSVCIGVEMSDKDIIDRVKSTVGAGNLTGPRLRKNYKPLYTWRLTMRPEIEQLAVYLLPHMGERRTKQLVLMLGFIRIMKGNGND